MEIKTFVEQGHRAFHFTRSLAYVGEYKLLNNFTKLFRPFVKVPEEPVDKAGHRNFIIKDIESLYAQDAKLFSQKTLPLSLLTPESPAQHLKRFSKILLMSVRMSRQRKMGQSKSKKVNDDSLPDYFKRNFHWQIDGYLSQESGEVYDHQVEILFTGTAAAMRRLVFFPLRDFLDHFQGEAAILELAAGTGEISEAVLKAYPQHQLTITDLSVPYLEIAKKRLRNFNPNIQQAMAEKLPFADASQDVIFSVFLFHEIPSEVRTKAIQEAMRVLKPKGRLIILDSIQRDEVPEYAWALRQFPIDYHEPFYKSYTEWDIKSSLEGAGFQNIESKRGFFSKVVWADKPS